MSRPLSIRTKLLVLVVVSVSLATSISAAVVLWHETKRYAEAKQDSLLSTASILAAATALPVSTGDADGVYRAIRVVGALRNIALVAVEDRRGTRIAELGAVDRLVDDLLLDENSGPIRLGDLLASRSIELSVPIVHAGERVGRLRLSSDASDLGARLWSTLRNTLAGLLGALGLGLVVALRLQRSITRPIMQITRMMARVSREHDYSVSLVAAGPGEVGVMVDSFNAMIGEIRQRDGRLARHREMLEQEVAERTRDAFEAKEAAETANSQKSEFLAVMSHEIRTPMNGMLVMAEMLAASDLPARSRRYAEVIARSGQSLLAIINDILDVSKVEAGKLELEIIAVDPHDVAEGILHLFMERARAKGLDLAARIGRDVPARISADPVRLAQIVGNLVNNALKFTESGGVLLNVDVEPRRPGHLRFTIEDTGIGIPADKLETIFTAFSQADQSTTRKFGGTGLGLSIARKLVGAMGAEIRVESVLGQGSAFSFSIACFEPGAPAALDWAALRRDGDRRATLSVAPGPTADVLVHCLAWAGYETRLVDGDEDEPSDILIAEAGRLSRDACGRRAGVVICLGSADAADMADAALALPLSQRDFFRLLEMIRDGADLAAPERPEQSSAAEKTYPSARVLVVDDSRLNLEIAEASLSRFGIAPVLVESGREALDLCARQSFDLVLMDGSMPDLDGFATTRLLRAQEAEAGRDPVPVVALTAHVIGAAASAWEDCGMNGVLHKPLTMSKLDECLRAHLAAGNQDSAAETRSADVAPVRPLADADDSLDVATLDQMRSTGSPDFVRRIVTLYRDHAPGALDLIARHSAAGAQGEAASAAHALKSMSLNVGAKKVARAASEIERGARSGDMPGPDDLAQLRDLLDRALRLLDDVARAAA